MVLEPAAPSTTASTTRTSTSTTSTTAPPSASSADEAATLLVEAWLAGDAAAAGAVAKAAVVDELFASSTAGVTASSANCLSFSFDTGDTICTFDSAAGTGSFTVSEPPRRVHGDGRDSGLRTHRTRPRRRYVLAMAGPGVDRQPTGAP